MLKIRLQRVGRKHEPSFRLVLTDSKNSTKSGRFKEILGSYDPRKTLEAFKPERIKHWISQGAGLTGSVNNLLIKRNIIRGKKVHVGMDHVVRSPQPSLEATAGEAEVKEEVKEEVVVEAVKAENVPMEEAASEVPAEEISSEEAPSEPVV
ncbi:MAG: 30S ribosomal protein S16 [Patescibacteria group bacterium]